MPCGPEGRTFKTMADSESGAGGEDCAYKWTKEKTREFIKLRAEMDHTFTGAEYSAWRTVLEKMGIQEKVTPIQAKKKWDSLKQKYKDCKYPGPGDGVSGKPTAATWPWFDFMVREESEDEDGQPGGRKRRRDNDEQLLELIREDMRLQREAEQQRAQERRETYDRLFSLLEKMVNKD